MFTRTYKNNFNSSFLLRTALILPIILCVLVVGINAQRNNTQKNPKVNLPVWQNYKGVAIGMTAAEAIEKLGAPTSENEGGLFYMFTEFETVQVLFDADKKVRTVSVIYTSEYPNPPKFADIFGKTAEDDSKPDGSIFKMVRYEDAGYWVSYNRMAGEQAMVIVVIQKL